MYRSLSVQPKNYLISLVTYSYPAYQQCKSANKNLRFTKNSDKIF